MKDLTQGSLPKHLVAMALPMSIGMFVQTLYVLTDLYFVSDLGSAPVAALSLIGNIMFLIFAVSQILNVGTATLVAHAVGEKDQSSANLVFNQALFASVALGTILLLTGIYGIKSYLHITSEDPATTEAALSYSYWFLPCLVLQFIMTTIGSALRGTGVVKPMMIAQIGSLIINIILSPILISGWLLGIEMGIAGAGLASSISVVIAVLSLWFYLNYDKRYLVLDSQLFLTFHRHTIKRLFSVGCPAGAELILMFVYMSTTFWVLKDFGTDVQAGFGIGSKVIQALFLPVMAVAFSLPAIAGQNYGAGNFKRFRQAFYWSLVATCSLMLGVSLLAAHLGAQLAMPFSEDPQVIEHTRYFLYVVAWSFIATGVIFTCSGLFQASGNTWPPLYSNTTRLFTFVLPIIWLVKQQQLTITELWYITVLSVVVQALVSLTFVAFSLRATYKLPATFTATKKNLLS